MRRPSDQKSSLLLITCLALWGFNCGENLDTTKCVALCQRCPDGKIITQATDCDEYCTAQKELVERAGCEDQWISGWDCHSDQTTCPKDSPQNCFNEEKNNWGDCVEDFLQES